MREGDLYIAILPQADGLEKPRPVLLLRRFPKHGDYLVCGVSTQLQSADPAVDLIIERSEADFAATGLRETSVLRLSHLFTLPTARLRGRLGVLWDDKMHELRQRLVQFLA